MTDEKHQDVKQAGGQSIPISGRFDQYRSSYWGAKLAAFGLRYPLRENMRSDWTQPDATFNKKHTYSTVTGGIMASVTGFFAYRTWKDVKTIFAEPVAWELGKEKDDVGFFDFMKSKNTMVQQTMSNYLHYNARRFGIDLFFFLPLIARPIVNKLNLPLNSRWHPDRWSPQLGEGLGLGANSAYLFSDILSRRITPFESLQNAIDRKVNHTEHAGDQMSAADLLDIYERHATHGKISSFVEHRGTPEWANSMLLFSRMADLMNRTYDNVYTKEESDFGISKFIYLIGNNLIKPHNVKESLLYVEVANACGIDVLKEVVQEVKDGATVDDLLKKYKVAIADTKHSLPSVYANEPAVVKYTEAVTGRAAEGYLGAATLAEKGEDTFVGRLKDSQMGPALSS